MTRDAWLWLGLGGVGVWLVFGRSTSPPLVATRLVLPLESAAALRVTPHGYYGAPRAGPPAHAHQGLDLAATPGASVLAVGDGTIVPTQPGLGKIVRKLRLDTPAAWRAGGRPVSAIVYADLGTRLVGAGDHVRRGDTIAHVSQAGFVHVAVKDVGPSGESFFNPAEAGLVARQLGQEIV